MPRSNDAKTQKAQQDFKSPIPFSQAVTQIGTTGIRRMGQYVREEFLVELQGRQGRAKLHEMSTYDVVKRALRAIKNPMLAATWTVEGGDGPDIEAARELVRQCMGDMYFTWYRTMDDILSGTMTYGASWYQVLYKRRQGRKWDKPLLSSEYDDGLWGWQEWSPRGQETWEGWEFDDTGHMTHLIQLDQFAGVGPVTIPLAQSLHFIIEGKLGDPNGESLLRSAYIPWYGLKHADDWIGILIERMAGISVFKVADENLAVFDSSDADMVALRAYLENAATAVRIDEQMGIVLPAGIEYKLESVPIKVDDVIAYIALCSWRILGSVLAQFLELGQAPKGSYGKSQSDKEFFMLALQGILGHTIAETINEREIPRLMAMNAGSFRLTENPRLVPSDLQVPNIADLAGPLKDLTQGMIVTPGPALETHVRQIGNLPEEEEGEAEVLGKRGDDNHDEGDEHCILADLIGNKGKAPSDGT